MSPHEYKVFRSTLHNFSQNMLKRLLEVSPVSPECLVAQMMVTSLIVATVTVM